MANYMRIKYIELGILVSGGLYGGYKGRKITIENYERRGYKNIPTKILILPTIIGTILGSIAFPLTNLMLISDLFDLTVRKYDNWTERQLKKENPDSK